MGWGQYIKILGWRISSNNGVKVIITVLALTAIMEEYCHVQRNLF